MEKKVLNIFIIYTIICLGYCIGTDILLETESAKLLRPFRGIFVLLGLVLSGVYALKHFKRIFKDRLRYWHSWLMSFSIFMFTFFLYRSYALIRYGESEVLFLTQNWLSITKGMLLSSIAVSAIIAIFFRKGKPDPSEKAKEIEAMFDIELSLQQSKNGKPF